MLSRFSLLHFRVPKFQPLNLTFCLIFHFPGARILDIICSAGFEETDVFREIPLLPGLLHWKSKLSWAHSCLFYSRWRKMVVKNGLSDLYCSGTSSQLDVLSINEQGSKVVFWGTINGCFNTIKWLLSVSDKANYELKSLCDFSEQSYVTLRVILIKILQPNTMGEMMNYVFQVFSSIALPSNITDE